MFKLRPTVTAFMCRLLKATSERKTKLGFLENGNKWLKKCYSDSTENFIHILYIGFLYLPYPKVFKMRQPRGKITFS